MVAEVDERAEHGGAGRLAQQRHANAVVDHLGAARVHGADAPVAPGDLGRLEPRRREPGHRRRERLAHARAQRLHVGVVDAAGDVAAAPDSLRVGALVVVGRVHQQIVEAELLLVRRSHALHEAVRQPHHVGRHDADAQRAVVEHRRHRLELVVHAGRRAPVLEARHPHRVEAAVAVAVFPAVLAGEAAVAVHVRPGVGRGGRDGGAAEAGAQAGLDAGRREGRREHEQCAEPSELPRDLHGAESTLRGPFSAPRPAPSSPAQPLPETRA